MKRLKGLDKVIFLWHPYKFVVFLIFASLIIFTVMEGVSIALIYTVFVQATQFVSRVETPSKVFGFIQAIADYIHTDEIFILSCILLIIAALIRAIFSLVNQYASFYLQSRIKRDLHEKIFSAFLNADYPFYFTHKQGWLMHRTMTVPMEVSFLLDYLPRIAVNLLRTIIIIFTLFFISTTFTAIMLVFTCFYFFIAKTIGKKISYGLGQKKVDELQRQNELASEAFAGIKQLKISVSVKNWLLNFESSINKYLHLQLREGIWLIMPPVLTEFLVIAVLISILIFIKISSPVNFTNILPVIAIFGYSIQRIIPSFNLLGSQIISFAGLLPVLNVVYELLSERKFMKDGSKDFFNLKNEISFENVHFSYSDRDPLFEGLSFKLKKGSRTAIVGVSGSGKSTIIDLLVRLLNPSKGGIFIDGINLQDIKITTWLEKIGLVAQDSFIFHGTIKSNITFGMQNADLNMVINAAKEANCHDFIMDFPEGYNTVVGDRGVKLSGGQKQRIAIARAIYRNPEILILDEATSSLDSISEAGVQKAIDNTSKGRTVVIIAHRLSTIINVDKVLVIHEGKVCEEGIPLDLMEKKGFYWRMYNSQIQTAEI